MRFGDDVIRVRIVNPTLSLDGFPRCLFKRASPNPLSSGCCSGLQSIILSPPLSELLWRLEKIVAPARGLIHRFSTLQLPSRLPQRRYIARSTENQCSLKATYGFRGVGTYLPQAGCTFPGRMVVGPQSMAPMDYRRSNRAWQSSHQLIRDLTHDFSYHHCVFRRIAGMMLKMGIWRGGEGFRIEAANAAPTFSQFLSTAGQPLQPPSASTVRTTP